MASSRAPARSSDLLPGYDAAVFAKHAALVSPASELAVTSLAGFRP
jgi:hypothetical protein